MLFYARMQHSDCRLPKTNVDQSFFDIWDALDIGLMGTLEARKKRWGFLLDALYLKISGDASTPEPLFRKRRRGGLPNSIAHRVTARHAI